MSSGFGCFGLVESWKTAGCYLLPGFLLKIRLVVPNLLRFDVFGKCMMNACRLFILVFGERYALLSWLEMSPWLGTFGLFSVEVSLVRAFIAAGGSLPASGVRLGHGSAQFRMVALGGSVVGTLRSDIFWL